MPHRLLSSTSLANMMCIGLNKSVFLSPSASSINDTNVETTSLNDHDDRSKSPASVSSGSKRRLDEDRVVSTTQSPSSHKRRKLMRYSTCTCQVEETCQTSDGASCCHKSQLHDRPNRKVQFGGHVTFVPATHTFSEDDMKELWYGLDECADMSEASKTAVHDYREQPQYKDMLRHVLCVALQCSYSPSPLAYLQTVRLNLPEEARGLELGLLPIRTRQRRHEHVRRVVHVQTQIVAGKIPIKNDEQIKAKALAIQSMRSSEASRLFAQLLARNVALDEQQQQLE